MRLEKQKKENIIEVRCTENSIVNEKLKKWGNYDCNRKIYQIDSLYENKVNRLLMKFFGVENGKYKTCTVEISNYFKYDKHYSELIDGYSIIEKTDIRYSDSDKANYNAYTLSDNVEKTKNDLIMYDVPFVLLELDKFQEIMNDEKYEVKITYNKSNVFK